MIKKELLEKNGWVIECESPFEIRHEDGSFASLSAAHSVVEELRTYEFINRLLLIKESYQGKLIDKEKFIEKTIEVLETYY